MADDLWSIGVDLGGTKIAAGLVDSSGIVRHDTIIATDVESGPQQIVQCIADQIKDLRNREKNISCVSVGVAVAGQIEAETGKVVFAPNLNWSNFHLQEALSKLVDLPIVIVNDVRAATYGEWYFGAGRDEKNFICLFIGTGIGGGIVIDGRLMQGSSNSAGELGHIVVNLDGPKCSCGNRGCLEALASGWAIAEIAQKLIQENPEKGISLLSSVSGNVKMITAKEVCSLALEKDPLSLQIIDGVIEALIAGTVSLVNAFNPLKIILGGGLVNGMPVIVEQINKGVRERALNVATQKLIIVQSQLKANSGVIGSAHLALKSKGSLK